ncbi:MAG: phosphoribosylformylglycinamidine synthase subunit PurS [Bacteroidia bacterium]|nr:phosphoribosylformylglycinamidine synthase subunit PurS [Bacteroidia bacterium]
MKYLAHIDIMPLKELLDPQGKAVTSGLKNLGLQDISNVRIGKHISLEVNANDKDSAQNQVETACKKLLANQVIESYEYSLNEVE